MDFGFTAENEAFREEVRQFIVEHITPEVQEELAQFRLQGPGPLTKELFVKLGQKGWIGMSWPKEYGVQGRDPIDQYIFEEEFVRAGTLRNALPSAVPSGRFRLFSTCVPTSSPGLTALNC